MYLVCYFIRIKLPHITLNSKTKISPTNLHFASQTIPCCIVLKRSFFACSHVKVKTSCLLQGSLTITHVLILVIFLFLISKIFFLIFVADTRSGLQNEEGWCTCGSGICSYRSWCVVQNNWYPCRKLHCSFTFFLLVQL